MSTVFPQFASISIGKLTGFWHGLKPETQTYLVVFLGALAFIILLTAIIVFAMREPSRHRHSHHHSSHRSSSPEEDEEEDAEEGLGDLVPRRKRRRRRREHRPRNPTLAEI
ncbi:MAG TPA: hypothetical protein VNZ22_10695, partial [Bacillota bacterium]|nr:hypothetical protein [Bacillota bacterium]